MRENRLISQFSAISSSLRLPSPYSSHQDQGPQHIPVSFLQEVGQQLGAPPVRHLFFFVVLRSNEVMDVVTKFVIQDTCQADRADRRNPDKDSGVDVAYPVDKELNPRWFSTPSVVITAQDPRFAERVFARSNPAPSFPVRKKRLVEKNHAVESSEVFFRDSTQERPSHSGGVKRRSVVAIGLDNSGLGIVHNKSLAILRDAEN